MTMFDDIATSIGTALGADKSVGGMVAGALFSIVLIFILEWTIGEDREGIVFLMSFGLGTALSGMFGWFPLWVPLVMALLIILILTKPFGGAKS